MGPKCLRWRAESPSGPVAGEFLACFIARETSKVVKGVKVEDGSERTALVSCRAIMFGWEGLMDVSSWFRAAAMSLSLWYVLLLRKVMEEFGSGCLGWFKSFIVLQSLCWSVLWSNEARWESHFVRLF